MGDDTIRSIVEKELKLFHQILQSCRFVFRTSYHTCQKIPRLPPRPRFAHNQHHTTLQQTLTLPSTGVGVPNKDINYFSGGLVDSGSLYQIEVGRLWQQVRKNGARERIPSNNSEFRRVQKVGTHSGKVGFLEIPCQSTDVSGCLCMYPNSLAM